MYASRDVGFEAFSRKALGRGVVPHNEGVDELLSFLVSLPAECRARTCKKFIG
jgi:hypothetical protein